MALSPVLDFYTFPRFPHERANFGHDWGIIADIIMDGGIGVETDKCGFQGGIVSH